MDSGVDVRMLVAICPTQPSSQRAGVAQWHMEHMPQHLYLYHEGEENTLLKVRRELRYQLKNLVCASVKPGAILTVVMLFYDSEGKRVGNVFEFSYTLTTTDSENAPNQDALVLLLVNKTMENVTAWIHAYRDIAAGYDG